MMDWLAGILLIVGFCFIAAGIVGLLRLPDFYARLHAMSKCDVLGVSLMAAGLAVHAGASLSAVKILLLAALVAGASATATHALGRAAFRSGLAPWLKDTPSP